MHGPSAMELPRSSERFDEIAEVERILGLQSQRHTDCDRARILRRSGSSPLAAIVLQGEKFRDDKTAIQTLKEVERDLPIIYIARTTQPRRETAIRRMCIHYYLTQPIEIGELKLVLEVLMRSAVSSGSFERFFTR